MSKNSNKIINFGKVLFFALFLAVEFFGFGLGQKANADGCVYGLTFDVNPKSLSYSGKVTFSTTVTVSGSTDAGLCSTFVNQVIIDYFTTSAGAPSTQPFFGLNDISGPITLNLSQTQGVKAQVQGQDTHDYYLNNFFSSNGTDKNGNAVVFPVQNGSFFVRVYQVNNDGSMGANVITSSVVPITITGPNTITPDKTSANLGDTITFTFGNMPAQWSGTVYINGTTNYVVIPPNSSTFALPVTVANGFNASGSNTLNFELNDSSGNSLPLSGNGQIMITTGSGNPGAQPSTTSPGAQPGSTTNPGAQPGQLGNSTVPTDHLYNPLPTADLTSTLVYIGKAFLGIIGVWSVVFIIVGGFRMVVAAGNEEALAVAKRTITWAILGLVIAVLSFSIIAIVQNLIGAKIQ